MRIAKVVHSDLMQSSDDHVTNLGLGYDRKDGRPFGIRLQDRLLHLYVIGKTGTGKSTLLFNMAKQDAANGMGFCLIDPHGDLAGQLANRLPDDAIIWNVADPDCPYGYNPLTKTSPALRPLVASGLIEALKKQWADAWGVRMEHLLRYALLALLDTPEPDLRQIVPLYLDKEFRRGVVAQIQDAQVRDFWMREFPTMNYKTAADGVAPIANKLGAFLAHPVIRTMLCEPKTPLRFRSIMDEGQMLVVNLAKGQLGSDLANVLGGLIVSAITNAAFSRQSLPESQRRPFMLYVDEFHAFTTDSFANALSETRKYGIGITLSHQHTSQTAPNVFAAIMGNVGSLMCFRIGALDAPILSRQLDDQPQTDLTNLPNHHAFMRMMVDGMQSKPFSLQTLPPDTPATSL